MTIGDEAQEYLNLPVDSVKIVHGTVTQYIVGHRAGNEVIAEGDMVFEKPFQQGVVGVAITRDLWPIVNDTIVIKYAFSTNVDSLRKTRIQAAIVMWQRVIRVKSKIRKSTDTSYVIFIESASTKSSIGRLKGKKQYIRFTAGRRAGNIAHEISHTLGYITNKIGVTATRS